MQIADKSAFQLVCPLLVLFFPIQIGTTSTEAFSQGSARRPSFRYTPTADMSASNEVVGIKKQQNKDWGVQLVNGTKLPASAVDPAAWATLRGAYNDRSRESYTLILKGKKYNFPCVALRAAAGLILSLPERTRRPKKGKTAVSPAAPVVHPVIAGSSRAGGTEVAQRASRPPSRVQTPAGSRTSSPARELTRIDPGLQWTGIGTLQIGEGGPVLRITGTFGKGDKAAKFNAKIILSNDTACNLLSCAHLSQPSRANIGDHEFTLQGTRGTPTIAWKDGNQAYKINNLVWENATSSYRAPNMQWNVPGLPRPLLLDMVSVVLSSIPGSLSSDQTAFQAGQTRLGAVTWGQRRNVSLQLLGLQAANRQTDFAGQSLSLRLSRTEIHEIVLSGLMMTLEYRHLIAGLVNGSIAVLILSQDGQTAILQWLPPRQPGKPVGQLKRLEVGLWKVETPIPQTSFWIQKTLRE
jgi:hypothetical protein